MDSVTIRKYMTLANERAVDARTTASPQVFECVPIVEFDELGVNSGHRSDIETDVAIGIASDDDTTIDKMKLLSLLWASDDLDKGRNVYVVMTGDCTWLCVGST